jgi:hypothetical protein
MTADMFRTPTPRVLPLTFIPPCIPTWAPSARLDRGAAELVPQGTSQRFRSCHSPSIERVRWSRSFHKESVMSNNNNERQELTAAELDLVVGAAIFMKIDGVKAPSVACDGIGAARLNDVEAIDLNAVHMGSFPRTEPRNNNHRNAAHNFPGALKQEKTVRLARIEQQ